MTRDGGSGQAVRPVRRSCASRPTVAGARPPGAWPGFRMRRVAQRSALIVDDSRTAREGLRRMLADHELRVETAESAEAALEYLIAHRPDVIFMDHMMPGMDGFQAVKAIKENPATATIPVMMYTSQSGELYVGQARALGAVGVLPKQIKPVEVREVLRSLHLLPGRRAARSRAPGERHSRHVQRRVGERARRLVRSPPLAPGDAGRPQPRAARRPRDDGQPRPGRAPADRPARRGAGQPRALLASRRPDRRRSPPWRRRSSGCTWTRKRSGGPSPGRTWVSSPS